MKKALKFFNIDLHIAIIGDIKGIFERFGHQVDTVSMSAHAWVMGRKQGSTSVIDLFNWQSIDQEMCDRFYSVYKHQLDEYDGFIVTYPPAFSLLFERFGKPIIVVAGTRYEAPFSSDVKKWEWFNSYLRRGIDVGLIIPVANNLYDAKYAERFLGRKWEVIESICDYTGMRYAPKKKEFLYWSKHKPLQLPSGLLDKEGLKPSRVSRFLAKTPLSRLGLGHRGFSWAQIGEFKGIVHVPYNVSLMSVFEQYSANIPLFFPEKTMLLELYGRYRSGGVLSELSFNQVNRLPPGSVIRGSLSDPNDYENLDTIGEWIDYSDFYGASGMNNLVYFNSWPDLMEKMKTVDLQNVSNEMQRTNLDRREKVVVQWRELLQQF